MELNGKMVDRTEEDYRDNAEVDVTENMDNDQPNGELVPRTEQNNDEKNVRKVLFIAFLVYFLWLSRKKMYRK